MPTPAFRTLTAVALALAATAPFAQAQDAAPSPRADEDRAILTARQDPGTLDYVKSNLTALRLWILANVVEPLVYFDQEDNASPGVAESWEISEDRTVYTFHIREANFSDGTPVTPDDVVYSLNAMSHSPVVANAAAFQAVSSIEKVDDRTVRVTLDRPSQNFWQGMGGMSGLIQPEAAASQIATNPIGTGPYRLSEYVSNSHLAFEANPEYWGEAPALKEVLVRIITDGTAGLNAIAAGEVDAAPVNTIDLWEQITNRGLDETFTLVTYPQIGEPTYAIVSSDIGPGIRQAIAQTLYRQAFNDAFGASWGAENTCTFALPHQSWYSPANEESCPYAAQLVLGARTSILVGVGGASISLVLGCIFGLAAAASGRLADDTIMRGADILLSIPGIVTALVLAATIGSGAGTTTLALTVFFTPSFTRVIRSAALGVLNEDFVAAARLCGRGRLFVLARHVVPNIAGVMIVQFTLYFAAGILVEAGLSYLGVGVNRPQISWGLMLNEAQQQVGVASPLAMWPGLAIVLVVLGLNLLGDGLRDVLDPRLARRAA